MGVIAGTGGNRRREPWLVPTAAVAVLLAVAAVVASMLVGRDDRPAAEAPASPSPSPAAQSPSPTGGPPPTAPAFEYQALWPFPDAAAVAAWQAQHRAGGAQPWHLDPERTALGFTTGYLGFTELDTVVSATVEGDEAWVAVGRTVQGGPPAVAAEVHLVRHGTGEDAPWEVVGTRDSTLTLTTPAYGSTAVSPLTVGGEVTGVDESLRVQVRQLGRDEPLGESCCLPAGGERTPWSVTVPFEGATGPALTVVVSTGGHAAEVERFAVTGLRA
ncbi:MAG TPA: hypothetical protein VGD67_06800 [Pseudonocardiaceae bacterium]